MNLKEKENLFQALFVVLIVILKRNFGEILGDYENIIFVFVAALGLFSVNWVLKRLDKSGSEGDNWEDKWDFVTFIFYGIALLVLHWLHVTNIWIMVIVGVLVIGINVIIKLKRREIKKNESGTKGV